MSSISCQQHFIFDGESVAAGSIHLRHKILALRVKWSTLVIGWGTSIWGRTAIEGAGGRGRVLEIGN